MTVQTLPNLVYVALVLIALLTPYATWRRSSSSADPIVMGVIVAAAALLTAARLGSFMLLSLILLLPLARLGAGALLGGLTALLLLAPVTWWTLRVQMGPAAATAFVLLALAAGYLPRLPAAQARTKAQPAMLPALALAAAVGLAVGLLTAPFGAREPIYFAWHHWGAYLSPVEAWLAGGLPYRDFPIQYGLGPTAVLAATCGSDCWRGIYATTIVANALYFAALAGCVVILTAGRSRGARWLALAALWCASFVWTAYPADLGSTAMTPSVAGLRFLPIAALLLHIINAERGGRRRDWLGHALWLCDVFWSPEAAFFGTLIWWPYLALRGAADTATARESWIALLRGAMRGVAALLAGLACLALVLWLISGGAVRPRDFLAYVLYPPGPLPLNPVGTVWLALASILLALHALAGSGRSSQGRALYACLLGFLAGATYFLSRSHDNNILNLFPLLVILLVASVQRGDDGERPPVFTDAFVTTVLAGIIAFIATAQWASWNEGAATEGLLNLGPSRLVARFSPRLEDQPRMLPPDAVRGLDYLRAHDGGAVVLLDENKLIPAHPAGEGWTAVNNVANFEPFPGSLVTHFICRGAVAYRRPGWVLVEEPRYGAWVAAFETAYEVREQIGFGTYRAYHLVPRADAPKCAGH
jgi:hypothetical protein